MLAFSRMMLLRQLSIFFAAGWLSTAPNAQTAEGVIARCGALAGKGYYFADNRFGLGAPVWQDDGISAGRIILVKLGDEWDIQFDDVLGATGYRNDGARVIPLGGTGELLRVGAFHENYADIYSFDLVAKKVVWSSNKTFPIAKVAAYVANCE